ncbi:MAG: hypothetical protein R3C45_09700 [Phycisphaerales bacterium]
MNEQRITELLDLADAGVTAPTIADPGLAECAIRRAQRRKQLRRIGMGVLAVDAVAAVVLCAIWFAPVSPNTPPAIVSVPVGAISDVVEPGYDVAELNARIAMQEKVVRTLLATQNIAEPYPTQSPDPLAQVQAQVDLAARRMVLTADRMERDGGRSDTSRGLYNDVVTTFPGSVWAGIARSRINEYGQPIEPRSAL